MTAAKQTLSRILAASAAGVLLAASVAQPSKATEEFQGPAPAGCLYTRSAKGAGETLCIRKDNFNRDLCSAIERSASDFQLPPDFFARLIWRESRFRADALSYKGAEGIAQFMPGTAKLRKLQNSYDVLEALHKSAEYLGELRDRFGNLGFAAAAYNAGENGLSNYLSGGSLPSETRAYVIGITSHSVDDWKAEAPDVAALPLDKIKTFLESCVALAESRKLREPVWQNEGPWMPWGVQIAAHANPDAARRLFAAAVSRLPAPLNAEQPLVMRQRDRSFGFRPRYVTRIARQTRDEADQLCAKIRKSNGTCLVFRN